MKKIIIILGMHRSGTSVVTQICRHMGAFLGKKEDLMGVAEDNPDGFFENIGIFELNNELLHLLGREWYSLDTQKPDFDDPQIINIMEKIKNIVQGLLEEKDIAAVKDPRISVLLPIWERILEKIDAEVTYVWVYRNPLEVMESLRNRNGYSSQHGIMLWLHYNLCILRFLAGKEYILINYRDALEHVQTFEQISRLFHRECDDPLRTELAHIIKRGYCHSNYTYQDVENTNNDLLAELYGALLEKKEIKEKLSDWEQRYDHMIKADKAGFADYEALENVSYLKQKKIIIYGAGSYGKKAAGMLQEMGITDFNFCDRDVRKQGMELMGGRVFSIAEMEKEKNILIIIAIENRELKCEIEQTLLCIKNACVLSFFALNKAWNYFICDYEKTESKIETFTFWYEHLVSRGNLIKKACQSPILVYQCGKVGSLTVSKTLWDAGIDNAHIHQFFYKRDTVGELVLGDGSEEFRRKSNIFHFQNSEYKKYVREEMKGKKIITLVRDPIAIDLSIVFQWMGRGNSDRYFAEQLRQGSTFNQSVSKLMVRIQNHLFDWFEDELKELCGINIFDYPFDRDKGYSTISEKGFEILILKTERLSQMADVLKDFIGSSALKLVNTNIGREKEYAHIYEKVKRNLELPPKYVEYYYNDNPYMNHFYSEAEQKRFLDKWSKCIKENYFNE